jgi:hypothetical protein
VALNDSTNVNVSSKFEIKFSAAVDKTTVNVNNIRLTKIDGNIPITLANPSISEDELTVTVKLATGVLLDDTKAYSLEAKNIKTKDGKSFATSTTKFTTNSNTVVTATQKADGSNSPVDFASGDILGGSYDDAADSVLVSFNKAIDASTVIASNIKLVNVTDGIQVPITVAVAGTTGDDAKKVKITFVSALLSSSAAKGFELSISGLKASVGNSVENYKLGFTVGTTAPEISGNISTFTKADITTGTVWPKLESGTDASGTYHSGAKFFITFDQAVDASTLTAKSVKLVDKKAGTTIDTVLSYDADGRRLSITPKSDLSEGVTYQIVLSTDIKNILGVKYAAETKTEFTTQDITKPVVQSVVSANGLDGLKVGKEQTITLKFSEAIQEIGGGTPAGSNDGTIKSGKSVALVKVGAATTPAGGDFIDIADKVTLANDNKDLVIKFVPAENNRNKTFKLIVAGKASNNNKYIIDRATTAQNPLASNYEVIFTTEGADVTPPTVSAVRIGEFADEKVIASGVQNVDESKAIHVLFSEKMDTTTLTDNTATGSAAANGEIIVEEWNSSTSAWDKLNKSTATTTNQYLSEYHYITISAGAFVANKKYRLTVSKNVEDSLDVKSGVDTTFEFITGSGPALSVSTSATAQKTVSTAANANGTSIVLNNATDINQNDWIVVELDNGSAQVVKVTNISGATITINNGLTYSAKVDNAVKVAPSVNEFGTGISVTDSVVVVVNGASGAAVDLSTINDSTVYLKDSKGVVVPATISATEADNNAVVVINPTDKLKNDETYTVGVTAGIKDKLGNIAKAKSYKFKTVAAEVTPNVTFANIVDRDFFTTYNRDSSIVLNFNGDLVTTGSGITVATDKNNYVLKKDNNGNGIIDSGENTSIPVNPVVDGKKVTLYPDTALDNNTNYVLTVANTITVGGRALSTNSDLDDTLAFKSNSDGGDLGIVKATYNTTSKLLKVTFNRTVRLADADTASDYSLTNGNLVIVGAPAISKDGLTITFLVDTTTANLVVGTTEIAANSTVNLYNSSGTTASGTEAVTITAE